MAGQHPQAEIKSDNLTLLPSKLVGAFEIRPKLYNDARGFFSETYLQDVFRSNGLITAWIQENKSFSRKKHTLRGLHFQTGGKSQTKLVSVPAGRILDVIVDLRKKSPTYGLWDSIEVSDSQSNSVYVPKGFAHGFCTLEQNTVVTYKVDELYSVDNERGIVWNDPDIGIKWPAADFFLSERDMSLPRFEEMESPF